jgi:hypothetical protein
MFEREFGVIKAISNFGWTFRLFVDDEDLLLRVWHSRFEEALLQIGELLFEENKFLPDFPVLFLVLELKEVHSIHSLQEILKRELVLLGVGVCGFGFRFG